MPVPRLSMRLRDVLFTHWAVPPETVQRSLPAGLTADSFEGDAYLGVVCMEVTDAGPSVVPMGRSYGEVNVRTYVTHPDGPGVHFRSIDLSDRLGTCLSRSLFGLPAHHASISVERRGEEVSVEAERDGSIARFAATYARDGDPFVPEAGTLAQFLTERYRFYTTCRGRLYAGDISHDPWRLFPARADIEADTLFEVNALPEPVGEPVFHYARRMDVTADGVRRLERE